MLLVADYGYNGFHGVIDDLWFGPTVLEPDPGDTFPDDPNNRLLTIAGQVVMPWTGDSTLPEMGIGGQPHNTHSVHFIDTSDVTGVALTKYFQMIGLDTGSPAQPFYHSWVVINNPDPTGAQAVGPDAPPNGGPLINIFVSAQWTQ
jgi:hypothetical protein